jgi:hypothetical protein
MSDLAPLEPPRNHNLTTYEQAVRLDFDLSPDVTAEMIAELREILQSGRRRDKIRASQVLLAMYRYNQVDRLAATHLPIAGECEPVTPEMFINYLRDDKHVALSAISTSAGVLASPLLTSL